MPIHQLHPRQSDQAVPNGNPDPDRTPQLQLHWGWVDTFIVILYLSSGLLMFESMQRVRFIIKALPFIVSLFMWVLVSRKLSRRDFPPGSVFLLTALAWLFMELFHPLTQYRAGFAQFVFQLSIAAPAFWVGRFINTPAKLQRALMMIFICNALSSTVGLMQVYDPATFKPGSYNNVQEARHEERDRTYVAANGAKITRPAGLTDTPGGVGPCALLTALLGLGLSARPKQKLTIRIFYASLALMGMMVLYLTQMRALFLVSLAAMSALLFLGTRRRGTLSTGWVAVSAASIILVAFSYAVSVGGESVYNRFVGIKEEGLLESYDTNRGRFLTTTFGELMYEYPLGAGVGRWGMMNFYFNDDNNQESPPIWSEIQFTGWLLDGGVPMWIFYGGAVLWSLLSAYRIAGRKGEGELAFLAAVVFSMNLAAAAYSVSQLPFNTAIGLSFWLLAAGLHGADQGRVRRRYRILWRAVPGPQAELLKPVSMAHPSGVPAK